MKKSCSIPAVKLMVNSFLLFMPILKYASELRFISKNLNWNIPIIMPASITAAFYASVTLS
jgi:hypothetical protein